MKKVVAVLLVVMMVGCLLAGCGTSEQSGQEPESSPSGQAATSEPGKEVVVHAYGLTPGYSMQFVDDYNALGTGITIEWEVPSNDPYTVLKTRFAANEAPDIFDLGPGDLSAWGERCADLTGEPFLETLKETAKENVTVDGQVLGFPYAFEASGFVYNKDLFEQAGITEVPTTLDELEAVCIQLQSAGIQPFGECWKEWGYLMHIFGTPFAYEENEQEVCEKLNAGEMKLADLTYMDNFFRLFDLTLDYGKGADSVGYGAVDQMADFAAGKMAMVKHGTWVTEYLNSINPDLRLGLLAVPITNNPDDTKLMTATTRYFTIHKESECLAETKEFINWFYENLQTYIVDEMKIAVPYDGVDMSNLGPLNEDMLAYVQEGKNFSTFGNIYWPAGFNVDLATPLQAYAADALDKDATLEELQKLYDNRVVK